MSCPSVSMASLSFMAWTPASLLLLRQKGWSSPAIFSCSTVLCASAFFAHPDKLISCTFNITIKSSPTSHCASYTPHLCICCTIGIKVCTADSSPKQATMDEIHKDIKNFLWVEKVLRVVISFTLLWWKLVPLFSLSPSHFLVWFCFASCSSSLDTVIFACKHPGNTIFFS